MDMLSGVGTLLVLAVAALTLLPRRSVSGRRVTLLRVLLPSWRFFEAPDVSFVLLARPLGHAGERPFVRIPPARRVRAWNALFAPGENLALAAHGLVETLMVELAELGPVPLHVAEGLVSFRLVQNAVCFYLARLEPAFERYQFKIAAEAGQGGSEEELLVSPVYTRRSV